MIRNKFVSIEQYGKRYMDDILLQINTPKPIDKNSYLVNSYEALKFFFSKAFYRGRRDEISMEFQNRAIKTLDGYNLFADVNSTDYGGLECSLRDNQVNNRKDRQMVIAAIEFVSKINNHNIVTHAINEIQDGKTENVYNQLIELPQIGPKLAALFLRDVVLLYGLKKHLSRDIEKYLQPIDTWVRQVGEKLEIISKDENDPLVIGKVIVDRCHDYSVCPLSFNAGAWYVGAKSFDLFLEIL